MIRDIGEHGAQIFEVEDRQPLLIGNAEANIEHALLTAVELNDPRHQYRPHLENGGADGMPLLPEQTPEYDRKLVGLIVDPEALGPGEKCLFGFARLGNAGEIALDVGGED